MFFFNPFAHIRHHLIRMELRIMETIDSVKQKLVDAKTAVDASNAKTDKVLAGVGDLRQQVKDLQAKGTPISQEDLQTLADTADSITASANSEGAKDDASNGDSTAPAAPGAPAGDGSVTAAPGSGVIGSGS